MPKEMFVVELLRSHGQPWGLRIGGGQDRGRVLLFEKVTFQSIAHDAGLRNRDFIVSINDTEVFGMSHNECTELIKKGGNCLVIKVERGDHIVPNLDEAFPKKKPDAENNSQLNGGKKPYWMKSLEDGQGVRNAAGFTTVGKPKMTTKQYNSPLEMYSEEALDEIMREGTLNGKPFDMNNIMNPTAKEFDTENSTVLQLIMETSSR